MIKDIVYVDLYDDFSRRYAYVDSRFSIDEDNKITLTGRLKINIDRSINFDDVTIMLNSKNDNIIRKIDSCTKIKNSFDIVRLIYNHFYYILNNYEIEYNGFLSTKINYEGSLNIQPSYYTLLDDGDYIQSDIIYTDRENYLHSIIYSTDEYNNRISELSMSHLAYKEIRDKVNHLERLHSGLDSEEYEKRLLEHHKEVIDSYNRVLDRLHGHNNSNITNQLMSGLLDFEDNDEYIEENTSEELMSEYIGSDMLSDYVQHNIGMIITDIKILKLLNKWSGLDVLYHYDNKNYMSNHMTDLRYYKKELIYTIIKEHKL